MAVLQKKVPVDSDLKRGLPMLAASDGEALAQEKAELAAVGRQSFGRRIRWYFSKSGPGWMQSAMTLGGGSAMASLYLGANYGYRMLWLQPLAMALGVVMLMGASHQTLSTGIRPFDAMKHYVHPALAWAWAIATLVSTVIWHVPQYALAAGVSEDILNAYTNLNLTGSAQNALLFAIALVILIISAAICWNYGGGHRGIRIYEKALKIMVWGIIASFLVVVVRAGLAGQIEWGNLLRGFVPLFVPREAHGVETLMAAFGSAVGINMTFLYGYSLLARGWTREYRGLARFDLITGMLIPYSLAVSLMVVVAGLTLHRGGPTGESIPPAKAGLLIADAGLGAFYGRIMFNLGILGMALSTITMHMLVTGFAACVVFGIEPGGVKYKLACLLPAPALVGVFYWAKLSTYIAIPTSAVCGLLLPVAYIGWFLLNNSARYLKDDKPAGPLAAVHNVGMLIAIAATSASILYYLYSRYEYFATLLT